MVAHSHCRATSKNVAIYVSPNGKQWVDRDDYEELLAESRITVAECQALGSMCAVIQGVLKKATDLTAQERQNVESWHATVTAMVYRLGE